MTFRGGVRAFRLEDVLIALEGDLSQALSPEFDPTEQAVTFTGAEDSLDLQATVTTSLESGAVSGGGQWLFCVWGDFAWK